MFISLLFHATFSKQIPLINHIPASKNNITVNFGSLRLKYAPTVIQMTRLSQPQHISLHNLISTHSFSHFVQGKQITTSYSLKISNSKFAHYIKSPISITSDPIALTLANQEYQNYTWGSSSVTFMSRDSSAYSTIAVSNCAFIRCTAPGAISVSESSDQGFAANTVCGGAIYVYTATSLSVKVCVFDSCAATSQGGSIYAYNVPTIDIMECKFYNSAAMVGSAITLSKSTTAKINYCLFSNCTSTVLTKTTNSPMWTNYAGSVFLNQVTSATVSVCGFTNCGPSKTDLTHPMYAEIYSLSGGLSVSDACWFNRNSYRFKFNVLVYFVASSGSLVQSGLSINSIDNGDQTYLYLSKIGSGSATGGALTDAASSDCQIGIVNTPAPSIMPTRSFARTPSQTDAPDRTSSPTDEPTPGPTNNQQTPSPTEQAKAIAGLTKKQKIGIGVGVPLAILFILLIILLIWCCMRDTRTAFKPNAEEVDDELAFRNV